MGCGGCGSGAGFDPHAAARKGEKFMGIGSSEGVIKSQARLDAEAAQAELDIEIAKKAESIKGKKEAAKAKKDEDKSSE